MNVAEIKQRVAQDHSNQTWDDIDWLIAECERLASVIDQAADLIENDWHYTKMPDKIRALKMRQE